MKKLIFIILCVAGTAFGGVATYYIDFQNGSDARNATQAQSTNTPWKTCPGMANASGHSGYTHAAGDRFIFKGGVTWPKECFQFAIENSGSASARDYYGVDTTWPSSGWTRPIFNMQTNGMAYPNIVVYVLGKYVTIDNIAFRGYYMSRTNDSWLTAYISVSSDGTADEAIIQNCDFFGGSRSLVDPPHKDNFYCVGSLSLTTTVSNCTFGTYSTTDFGGAIGGQYKLITGNIISNWLNAIVVQTKDAEITLSYNDIGPQPVDTDYDCAYGAEGTTHPNSIEVFHKPSTSWSRVYIHHNKIHDIYNSTAIQTMLIGGEPAPGNMTNYVWDNVLWNVALPLFILDERCGHTVGYAWNNTFKPYSDQTYMFATNGGAYTSILYATNNHAINTVGICKSTVVSYLGNSLVQSVSAAGANGYLLENQWRPTSTNGLTVNRGVESAYATNDFDGNLRPQGSAWDIGAYEYVEDGTAYNVPVITMIENVGNATMKAVTWTCAVNPTSDFLIEYGTTATTNSAFPYSRSFVPKARTGTVQVKLGPVPWRFRVTARDVGGTTYSSAIVTNDVKVAGFLPLPFK